MTTTGEDRLQLLRESETAFTEALAAFDVIREDTKPTIDQFLWSLRVALENQANGRPVGEPDDGIVTEGLAALAVRDDADRTVDEAGTRLSTEIAAVTTTNRWAIGDRVRSPITNRVLIVAAIYRPEADPSLAEVTLTADGEPIEKAQHSYQLDSDGQVIEDGVDPVRYERWWLGGYRVGGNVHRESRRLL